MSEPNTLGQALSGRPPQEQARVLARIGRSLRDGLAGRGENTAEADSSLALVEQWARDQQVSGRAFSDQIYSETEKGVLRRLMDAKEPASATLWNALVTDVMYVAWLAYRKSGERMPEDVSEVDETTLDLLDRLWRETPVYDPAILSS